MPQDKQQLNELPSRWLAKNLMGRAKNAYNSRKEEPSAEEMPQPEEKPAAKPSGNVSKLAGMIVKNGYEDEILQWMNENLTESVLLEKTLTNRQIKDIFQIMVDKLAPENTGVPVDDVDTDIDDTRFGHPGDNPEPPLAAAGHELSKATGQRMDVRNSIDFRSKNSLYEFFNSILSPRLGRRRKL